MANLIKITTCIALVIIFAALFQLAIKWRSDLPLISLCCETEGSCDDLDTVTSKKIDHSWSPDITYKVIKSMPTCDDGLLNIITEFKVKKNGLLAFSESPHETTTCGVHEYCLDTSSNQKVLAKVCFEPKCSASRKISMFWIVNLIVVPCILITIFVYIFFGKIGKNQTKFLLFYVIHLVLLHVCFAVTKIFLNEFSESKFCDSMTYASYYSLLGCFSWLCVICHNIWRKLNFKAAKSVESGAPLQGGNSKQDAKEQFYFYCLIALGVPTIITIIISVIDKFIGAADFKQCLRLQHEMKSFKFDYVYLPIAVAMTCGIIFYSKTKSRLSQTIKTITNIASDIRDNLQEERKRFMIYWRLFLVMFISWILFIIFDPLKPHVVTIMNVLHIIALVSLLNAAIQSPSSLIERVRSFTRQQSEVDTSRSNVVPPTQRPFMGWKFDN